MNGRRKIVNGEKIDRESSTMEKDLFRGELVRLAVDEPQTVADSFSRWVRDTEYWRLANSNPVRAVSSKAVKEWLKKKPENTRGDQFIFSIRILQDDRLIGDVGLDGVLWSHGDAFMGIGIGDREYWGKGYGTDAMHLILRYAFIELNLQRVSLNVFEYNLRAIRSYEKLGFVHEGRSRGVLRRDGCRYDLVFMGILREEWLAQNKNGYK
jgi:RimJ/RimL family protein N-acetyltransferase